MNKTKDRIKYLHDYYRKNKKKLDAQTRKWIKANPEARRKASSKYYYSHKAKVQARVKAWQKKNADRRREIARDSAKRRYWEKRIKK